VSLVVLTLNVDRFAEESEAFTKYFFKAILLLIRLPHSHISISKFINFGNFMSKFPCCLPQTDQFLC
jgi:hypothetical protein